MKNKVQQISRICDKTEQNLSKENVFVDNKQLQQTFVNLYSSRSSYRFIFDFPTRNFDYVSNDVSKVLEKDLPSFSPVALFSFIHDILKTFSKNTWRISDMNNCHQVDKFCIKKKADIKI